MLDLPNSYNLLESLNYWINTIREQSDIILEEVLEKDESLINRFKLKQNNIFENHEDKNRVYTLPFPTIVIGQKYDSFEKLDVENRKWITRGLRFLSHKAGCSLYFSSSANK